MRALSFHHAHKVTETSTDAFILRIYRQENEKSFVKAFTDEAGALVSGFHKVGKVLRQLTVRKMYLWPRFQATVSDSLSSTMRALSFHVQCFSDLFDNDGLLVLGKGLGMRKMLARFVRLYCSSKNLVFLLNANHEASALLEALSTEGVPTCQLPKMYKKGGCFLVTSRILILDFLNKRVPPQLVSGFLVHHAHKVTETSTDAFILRIYRQENEKSFVKAFTDEAGALVSGFHKVGKVLRQLTVRKMYLWPRFQATVSDSLSSTMRALSFHVQCFSDLFDNDGLLVLGKGLGMRKMLARFVRLYCSSKNLVFLLNANHEASALLEALSTEGVPTCQLPKVIDNQVSSTEREQMYKKGGCFLVTSRILILDFLNKRVPPQLVSGFLVHHAHKVTETSTDAFILRIYRQENEKGFVKAFTDEAGALVSGFHKVEKVLRQLTVRKLYLWPRFQATVSDSLSAYPPEVVELMQPLTPSMCAVQQAIAVAMSACLQELRKLTRIDISGLKVEDSLFQEFDVAVRVQLEPMWHRISAKPKQLLSDIRTLRQLLLYLVRYDAVTFYTYLVSLKEQQNAQIGQQSLWLLTAAADQLFRHAKARLYEVNPLDSDTACTIQTTTPTGIKEVGSVGAPTEPVNIDGKGSAVQLGGHLPALKMTPVLEESPKWELLAEVMGEIEQEIAAQRQQLPEKKFDRKTKPHSIADDYVVLIMACEDRACIQIRDFLEKGGKNLMQSLFLGFLQRQNERLKQRRGQNKARLRTKGRGKGKGKSKGNSYSYYGYDTHAGGRGSSQMGSSGLGSSSSSTGIEHGLWVEEQARLEKSCRDSNSQTLHTRKLNVELRLSSAMSDKDINEKCGGANGSDKKEKQTKRRKTASSGSDSGRNAMSKLPPWMNSHKDMLGTHDETMTHCNLNQNNEKNKVKADKLMSRAVDDALVLAVEKDGTSSAASPATPTKAGKTPDEETDRRTRVVVSCYSQNEQTKSILEAVKPTFVILFDPDVAFVRELEVYHAEMALQHCGLPPPLRVYFLLYSDSVEEQIYLSSLRKEQEAFEALVRHKAHLVLPAQLGEGAALAMKAKREKMETEMAFDTRLSESNQGRSKKHISGTQVIVDVREFRAALPSLLHQHGLTIVPLTIEVGDFVLTPEIVIERKSLTDLFGSLNNGRLFNQAVAMSRYYACPALLIEFSPGRPFSLQSAQHLGTEIQLTSVCSKMVLLTLHHPQLRVLWSRSPHSTVKLFVELKKQQPDADVQAAIAAGGEGSVTTTADTTSTLSTSTKQNGTEEQKNAECMDSTKINANELLQRLPGVTPAAARILRDYPGGMSLFTLSQLSNDQLSAMIGKGNGGKLYRFLQKTI